MKEFELKPCPFCRKNQVLRNTTKLVTEEVTEMPR